MSPFGSVYDEFMVWSLFAVGTSAMHHVYVDESGNNQTFAEAADQLTRVVAGKLNLAAHSHLLDIGCGAGQPAILITRETGCRVTGVNLGTHQVAAARASALAVGRPDELTFHVADAIALPFPNNTYDAALFFESMALMPDHTTVVTEAARCLKPGGRLVVADLSFIPDEPDETWRIRLAEAFPGASPLDLDQLHTTCEQAGLVIEDVMDITRQTADAMPWYVREAHAHRDEATSVLGAQRFEEGLQVVRGFAELLPGHTRYVVSTARKPVPTQ